MNKILFMCVCECACVINKLLSFFYLFNFKNVSLFQNLRRTNAQKNLYVILKVIAFYTYIASFVLPNFLLIIIINYRELSGFGKYNIEEDGSSIYI